MTTNLTAEPDQIMADFNNLTHEDVEQIHAQEGTGCKACDNNPTTGGWWRCQGDIYCFD